MVSQKSTIKPTIDLDAVGAHHGYLKLPMSVTRSAYGWVPIPIVSVKNGEGPTVLLVGGNHGDEYEGQVALMDFIRTVRVEDVKGQVIVLSAANYPAVMAAARVSPLDDGNLNREFPGRADGSPTQMIAHYISSELAPRLDYSLDIHSGGASLNYIPTVLTLRPEDPVERAKVRQLVEALALPFTTVFRGSGVSGGRTLASVVRGHGAIPLAAEMGGAATLTPRTVALAKGALRRYLRATGVWTGQAPSADQPTTFVAAGPEDYVYTLEAGVFEPACGLGDRVNEGQLAGVVHDPKTPWRPPVEIHFGRAGAIVCERPLSFCEPGDCLFQTCQPWPQALD